MHKFEKQFEEMFFCGGGGGGGGGQKDIFFRIRARNCGLPLVESKPYFRNGRQKQI